MGDEVRTYFTVAKLEKHWSNDQGDKIGKGKCDDLLYDWPDL